MKYWLRYSWRGACMGIADVIPGVSGGTLALILGIYTRFISALSAVGPTTLIHVLKAEFWSKLIRALKDPQSLGDEPIDKTVGHVIFLLFVGLGIAAAVVTAARFIPDLLNRYPAQMKAFFFGLVLASVVIPFRLIERRQPKHVLAATLAMIATFLLMGLPLSQDQRAQGELTIQLDSPQAGSVTLPAMSTLFMTDRHGASHKREVVFGPKSDIVINAGATNVTVPIVARMVGESSNLGAHQLTRFEGALEGVSLRQTTPMAGGQDPALWFVFLAGFIAISAMVLPGISGSFLLLMFGLYHYMTYTLRAVVYDRDADSFMVASVFGVALILGITLFSRFLNWLLLRAHDVTMAALVGLMLGSLRRLWPFTATEPSGYVSNVLPATFDSTAIAATVLFVLGALIVTGLDRAGRRLSTKSH